MKKYLLQELALPCFWIFFFVAFDGKGQPEMLKNDLFELRTASEAVAAKPRGNQANAFIRAIYLPRLKR